MQPRFEYTVRSDNYVESLCVVAECLGDFINGSAPIVRANSRFGCIYQSFVIFSELILHHFLVVQLYRFGHGTNAVRNCLVGTHNTRATIQGSPGRNASASSKFKESLSQKRMCRRRRRCLLTENLATNAGIGQTLGYVSTRRPNLISKSCQRFAIEDVNDVDGAILLASRCRNRSTESIRIASAARPAENLPSGRRFLLSTFIL
mmetsp:Transcript_3411/g.9685  ORF Transcript_3411/g.9685 Transcript_3411/m.9685 type:complete len:205 (+) Transcript_3411:383-997(+)